MEANVESFRARLNPEWLLGESPERSLNAFDAALSKIDGSGPVVAIDTANARSFLMEALATLALGKTALLWSPEWTRQQKDFLWQYSNTGKIVSQANGPRLLVATGGSGGKLRFAVHSWEGLVSAVHGYTKFWQKRRLDCVNLLPLYHVGGFVPAMRSFISGGRLSLGEWKSCQGGEYPEIPSGKTHLSLVSTQLKRLLETDTGIAFLQTFEAVLIGGGAVSVQLLEKAWKQSIAACPAYGMTEALGTIAILRTPDKLSNGVSGEVLPHWNVRIVNGEIEICGSALFTGYWGEPMRSSSWHATGDLGKLVESNRLHVSGRKDRMIITGGEKVNPLLVEDALRASGVCKDAVVLGIKDAEWGQRVVAVLEAQTPPSEKLLIQLREMLPPYAVPKAYRYFPTMPRNALGKVDRQALEALFTAS